MQQKILFHKRGWSWECPLLVWVIDENFGCNESGVPHPSLVQTNMNHFLLCFPNSVSGFSVCSSKKLSFVAAVIYGWFFKEFQMTLTWLDKHFVTLATCFNHKKFSFCFLLPQSYNKLLNTDKSKCRETFCNSEKVPQCFKNS